MHVHSAINPDSRCADCLRLAIAESTEETGLVNAWRWWLAALEGDANRCKSCGLLQMNENMIKGFCPECAELFVITEICEVE